MAFSIVDLHDLIKLLETRPEWRAELRRLLISDELLEVPQLLRSMAQALERSDTRHSALEEALQQLVQAQVRTEARLEQLVQAQAQTEARLQELAQAQVRTEARLDELAQAQVRTEARHEELSQAQMRMEAILRSQSRDLGRLKGSDAENRFRTRAHALLGQQLRRTHVLTSDEVVELVDAAEEAGTFTSAERGDVLLTDAILRGRHRDDRRQVYVMVEVSWGVGVTDVSRAVHRAGLLAKTGLEVMPLVAGERITDEAERLAQTLGVEFVAMRSDDEAETDSPAA